MAELNGPITILVADDDPDDQLLIKEALKESRVVNRLDCVPDGVELMEYLRRQGRFKDRDGPELPGIILLDLNMPRKDGREAIAEIRADDKLKSVPIVVLTTSDAEADIFRTYNLGVNSYITKPVSFEALIDVMKCVADYWFQIVTLPCQYE